MKIGTKIALDQVLAAEHTVEGSFTLGCHPSVAIYCLPTFLKSMLANNHKLTISLLHGLSREILEAVVSFRADFGIVVNPVRHPDLVVKELCRDRVTLWSVANTNRNVIVYEPSLFQSQTLIDQLNRNDQLTKWLPTSDLEVAAALTASGVGIGILPTRVAKRMASLHMIENALFVDDTVCLVYRADLHISAARCHIIDVIRGAQF